MPEFQTGKLIEWDDQKGYGFLQSGAARIFLHRRDFSEWHKRPRIGDEIEFILGNDAKRRVCAMAARHKNDGGRITWPVLLILGLLLFYPVKALLNTSLDWRLAGGYLLVISTISYACIAADKKRAQRKDWRFSENNLHVTELIGGWPGSFLGQHKFRHKTSKTSYQFIFLIIVGTYQFIAFDSLQDWRITRAAMGQPPTKRPVILIITNAPSASHLLPKANVR